MHLIKTFKGLSLIRYSLILVLTILCIQSCSNKSRDKDLAIKNCISGLIDNGGIQNDVEIICPCVINKMFAEFQHNEKMMQQIIKWNVDSIQVQARLNGYREKINKLSHSCIYLPGVENSEYYSDYSPREMEHLKLLLEISVRKYQKDTLINPEEFSPCILRKIMEKYTYQELYSDKQTHPFNQKKFKLKLAKFEKECLEN